ncbi:TrkA C-terminal domain-containing protein [Cellulomonas cellasea]|uniref:aspartate:alanine exchanger family transporter n=1 Tax=Cellulomonas cellasea TaxID=43670 RepID=UPI0025A3CC8C|nr:TrkA C-terminal domain-containing protein [Cellulomonas cellasea]MDM8084307.1 TrkA C-terminal domain-containing protein [Cellulomonas cellasea]
MIEVLAASPLLTILLVLALGSLLGAVPFGPLRFGAAGALFVGLAVGALDPRLGEGLGLLQSLGLALFVYTVGLAAGNSFFRDLRRQLPIMAVSVVILVIAAGITIVLAGGFDIASSIASGIFAGSLTSTPALAAATAAADGSQEPAVGYALSYPVGVTVSIIVVALTVGRAWRARRDPESAARQGLVDISVEVHRAGPLRDVPGFSDGSVRFSYLARDGHTRVVTADEELREGDVVVVVGPAPDVQRAREYLGERVGQHLAHDRSVVDFRRFLLSSPKVAGRTVGELDIPAKFGGTVTRVRRGDLDLLASDDFVLELGDRVRVIVPREEMPAVSQLFGDSERKVSEVDALSLGVGLVLGLLLGLVQVPLPGGTTFALGAAAGPLVAGMVLGRLERTGPLVWGLPQSANLTIRQLGLLLFLAATGLASGQAFAGQAFSLLGLKIVIEAVVVVGAASVLFVVLARLIGVSSARAAGGLAGFVGQPAVLAYANSRTVDERIDSGYAAIFALGIIVKIILAPVVALI